MRSTGRTSGCGSGANSAGCPTCWPPAATTRWPPSTGGSAGSALIAEVPAEAWARRSAGAGAHGQRFYDWARIELLAGFDPGWARWVLARRSIPASPGDPAELAYYVCAGPVETALEQLVAVAGGRWRIEECFQAAKNEAGLASYQVRDYTA